MKLLSVILFFSLCYSISKNQIINFSKSTGLSEIKWELIVNPNVSDKKAVDELFLALYKAKITSDLDPASINVLKEYYRVNFHQEVIKTSELIKQGKTKEILQSLKKSREKIKETTV